jgi:tetratricopeptide (TPR) repeat protein
MSEVRETLGFRIKEARLKKGLTQAQLGEGIVTPSMISQIESDKAMPSYPVLEAIADRLEIPLDSLVIDAVAETNLGTIYKLAEGRLRLEDYDHALRLFKSLLGHNSAHFKQCDLHHNLGLCYLGKGDYQKANEHLLTALQQNEMKEDTTTIVAICIALSKTFVSLSSYQESLFYLMKALSLHESINPYDPMERGQLYTQIGETYALIGKLDQAVVFYKKAVREFKNLNNLGEMGLAYHLLAEVLERKQQHKLAYKYATYSLQILKTNQDLRERFSVERRLLMLERQISKNHETLEGLQELIRHFKMFDDGVSAAEVEVDIAKVYLESSDYELAEKYAHRAKSVLPVNNKRLGEVHQILAIIYRHHGEQQQAEEMLKQALDLFKLNGQLAEYHNTADLMCSWFQETGKLDKAFEVLADAQKFIVETLNSRGICL